MKYKFSQIDSTKNKTLYMYFPYSGKKFLDTYLRNRAETIKFLKKKNYKNVYTQIPKKSDRIKNITKFIILFSNELQKKKIRIKNLGKIAITIDDLINTVLAKKTLNKKKINFLIKTYEIKKYIPISNEQIKINKSSLNQTEEIYHYKFCLLLIYNSNLRKDILKSFNALLKMNDFMIYKLYDKKLFNGELLLLSLLCEIFFFNYINNNCRGS